MRSDPLEVSATEHGAVRIFSTELDPEDAAAITAQNVHRLLGDNVELNAGKVEVINSKMLAGLGLRNYLIQGYGIPEEDLRGKAAAIDALNGLIVLIPTSAFQGKSQTLDPNPAIRFIGMFEEAAPAIPDGMGDHTSAKGAVAPPETVLSAPPSNSNRSWIGAIGALVIAAALVLWVVL